MDEWPDIKPPGEFTGKGFEIIGDPSSEAQITLHFRDGVFDMMAMPGRELPRPGTEDALNNHEQRREAERRALHLRENPEDHQARSRLRTIPKDRTAQRAVKEIKAGGPLTDWPFHLRRERAAIVALMKAAEEHGRPPTESEVIARMMNLTGKEMAETDSVKFLQGGDPQHLREFLRTMGIVAWLERRPRGRPRSR